MVAVIGRRLFAFRLRLICTGFQIGGALPGLTTATDCQAYASGGTISEAPANNSSTSTLLRNVSSLILPNSLNPDQRPATMNGRPPAYSASVPVVILPATACDIEIT